MEKIQLVLLLPLCLKITVGNDMTYFIIYIYMIVGIDLACFIIYLYIIIGKYRTYLNNYLYITMGKEPAKKTMYLIYLVHGSCRSLMGLILQQKLLGWVYTSRYDYFISSISFHNITLDCAQEHTQMYVVYQVI